MELKLTQLQTDALKEMVSIGAGNAATALSQLVKKKTTIKVPNATLCPIDKAPEVFGGAEVLVAAIYLRLLGDASGVILFSFEKNEAGRLADLLLAKAPGTTKILNEMDQSALKETATILSGAYLSAIAKFLKMRLLVSSPAFAEDMAGAIVDNILIETSKEADYFFIIDTDLEIVEEKVKAYFFFIPDAESLKKIMLAMGVNSGA
ncbi:MAG: chemotaxis protein CheC [Candidatus Omnitrophota bacterium]